MVTGKARRGGLLLAGAVLAVSASTLACAAVLGLERLSEDGAADSAPEGSAEPDAAVLDAACADLGLPARPVSAPGSPSAGPGLFSVALNVLDLGIDPTAPPVGLNLDGVCSQDVATSSCATAVANDIWAPFGVDRNDKGLDNAGPALLGSLSTLGDVFSPTKINQRLQAGGFGLLLRIGNYNGLANDDAVVVEIFPALGVQQLDDGGTYDAGRLDSSGKLTFAHTDRWTLDERFLLPGTGASTMRSQSAYVADGRLVASFDQVLLPLSVPDDPKPFDIELRGFYVSGDLSFKSGAWALSNGLFAGRWRTRQFFEQLRTAYVLGSVGVVDAYLCDPQLRPLYDAVKTAICRARDIRSDTQGHTSLPCDAFSAGLRFETYAVDALGSFMPGPRVEPRCVDAGVVPTGEDCAP